MSENRYIGGYPAIGIRPIVDGRQGPMQLRESSRFWQKTQPSEQPEKKTVPLPVAAERTGSSQ